MPAARLRHSELAVLFSGGAVAALSLTAGGDGSPPFVMSNYPVGRPASALTADFGAPHRWNGSHDEASYDPLALSFAIDEDSKRVFGVTVATDRRAASAVPQVALALRRGPGSTLVSGIAIQGRN